MPHLGFKSTTSAPVATVCQHDNCAGPWYMLKGLKGCGSGCTGAAYFLPCAAWLWPEDDPEHSSLILQPPAQNLAEALIPPAPVDLVPPEGSKCTDKAPKVGPSAGEPEVLAVAPSSESASICKGSLQNCCAAVQGSKGGRGTSAIRGKSSLPARGKLSDHTSHRQARSPVTEVKRRRLFVSHDQCLAHTSSR